MVAADFNGDGKLDLTVSGDYVSVLLGKGDGTFFGVLPKISVGGNGTFSGNVTFMAAGDFNGDGKADLAVTTTIGRQTFHERAAHSEALIHRRSSPSAEQAKHVGDEENQQYCPQSYTSPAARTPAGMAVVPSTDAKN